MNIDDKKIFQATFNHVIPICITDTEYNIIKANDAYWSFFGPLNPAEEDNHKCYNHRPGASCHTEKCPLQQVLAGTEKFTCEPTKEKNGRTHYLIVTAKPLKDDAGNVLGVVEFFQDISERKEFENERQQLIKELQASLEQVKLLSGFLPICAYCKKVRDDSGYWSQIESYIRDHSEAEFSHGICPDCVKKFKEK